MNDIKNVCVYSASSTKIAKVYFDVAEELGRLLAEKKINLINGAGCIGLMAATSDAALAAGGTVTGVIPHFMVEQGWHAIFSHWEPNTIPYTGAGDAAIEPLVKSIANDATSD